MRRKIDHWQFSGIAGVWASVSAAHSDGVDLTVPGVKQTDGSRRTEVASAVEAFSSVNTSGRAWWGPATAQWFYMHRTQVAPVGVYGTLFNNRGTKLDDTRMMAEVRFEPHLTSNIELLARIHPRIAVISVGKDNDYGHPRPETLAALDARPGLDVYRTDENGRIVVESDGRSLSVHAER